MQKNSWIIQGLRGHSIRHLNRKLWIFQLKLFENISRNSPWRLIKFNSNLRVKAIEIFFTLPNLFLSTALCRGPGKRKASVASIHSFIRLFINCFNIRVACRLIHDCRRCTTQMGAEKILKLFSFNFNIASTPSIAKHLAHRWTSDFPD